MTKTAHGITLESGEFIPASELRGLVPELRAAQGFDAADMATASAKGFRDGESSERTRCAQAVRDTLANWRCIPSEHLREFAELVLQAIESLSNRARIYPEPG